MAGSTSALTSLMDVAGSVLSGISDYYASEDEDAYNATLRAWERLKEKTAQENEAKRDRVQRRNEAMSQMGGGYESRSPTEKKLFGSTPPPPSYDTSNYLNAGVTVLSDVSDLIGGISGGSGGGSDTSSVPKSDQYSSGHSPTSTPNVDMNTASSQPTYAMNNSGYSYQNRYEPTKRYLTADNSTRGA